MKHDLGAGMLMIGLASAMAASSVLAQPLPAREPSAEAEAETGDETGDNMDAEIADQQPEFEGPGLLAGPSVDHNRPALLESGLTMAMAPMMAQRRELRQPMVADLFRQLGHEAMPDPLRLTGEQQARLREIKQAHRRMLRDYRAEHATLLTALRQAAGYTVPREQRPPPTPDQIEARSRLRALQAAGPTNAQLQTRMFAVLTEAQQSWADARIVDIVRRSEREAGERRYQRQLEAAAPRLEDYLDETGAVDLGALPDRLRMRFEQFAPERRLRVLRRLIEGETGDG
ncbi:MAG: hypothetical protein AAGF47_03590 [Planctomycetota bacterium]